MMPTNTSQCLDVNETDGHKADDELKITILPEPCSGKDFDTPRNFSYIASR